MKKETFDNGCSPPLSKFHSSSWLGFHGYQAYETPLGSVNYHSNTIVSLSYLLLVPLCATPLCFWPRSSGHVTQPSVSQLNRPCSSLSIQNSWQYPSRDVQLPCAHLQSPRILLITLHGQITKNRPYLSQMTQGEQEPFLSSFCGIVHSRYSIHICWTNCQTGEC